VRWVSRLFSGPAIEDRKRTIGSARKRFGT
jgi:hypothetical protein